MKNKPRQQAFCLCLLLCLSFFGLYGGCGGNTATQEDPDAVTRQKIFPNQRNKIKVNAQSPIQGTEVLFAKDSITKTQTVSISRTDQPSDLPSGYIKAGEAINFSTNASTRFAKPVQVKLPYPDTDQDDSIDGSRISENEVKVLYWNNNLDKWQAKYVQNVEEQNNLAKFETIHFSTYLTAIQVRDGIINDPDTQFITGESFVGEPDFAWTSDPDTGEWQKQMVDPGGGPEYMTVRRNETELEAVVGPFVTTGTSHPARLDTPDFASATFNATNIYPKVAESGDAANWNWRCDFVGEHTHLRSYKAVEERLREPGEDAIFCRTEVVNSNLVRLIWQINANEEITQGRRLAIEFMATYAQ